jgi:flagellar P-ring protein precursor FlgI
MNRIRTTLGLMLLFATSVSSRPAAGITVHDITRVKGEGEIKLIGLGLVTGLRGTGDDSKDPAVSRPLAQLMKGGGNELGSLKDLGKSKSVAIVWVSCTIPENGARADDKIDVKITTMLSASSLLGGMLVPTPLMGALPGQPVVALAAGQVDLEDPAVPTHARSRDAAVMMQDAPGPELSDEFDLIIRAPFSGWSAANQIAISINAKADPINNSVAVARDDRTVHVTIPKPERAAKAAFLADVFAADVNAALLDLPAQVIVNQRSGAIIVTGDVQIRASGVTHRSLSINTVTPPPVGTPANPVVKRDTWTDLKPGATAAESAKLTDLINALKQLNVPVSEQISLLQMLNKNGALQARLVID